MAFLNVLNIGLLGVLFWLNIAVWRIENRIAKKQALLRELRGQR